jgi:hypothetical protein
MHLAFDKSTVRTIDQFGRMHVSVSNISKAAVNPYRGNEILEWQSLGLDPDKVYYLLRDPAELEKAAPTFNNIPILNKHVPVTVEKPEKEHVVGSTGTDAALADPYLRNSLVIWDAVAIAGINTKQQCELSSAYWYEADMTPGTFGGVRYDGIMRNIRGNHVALVDVGRAGPDVIVGDSKLLENPKMSGKKKLSAKAIAVRGALKAFLLPKLAQDAQIGDLTAIVGSVKAATYAKDKLGVIEAVKKAFVPGKLLAQDADIEGLVGLLDALSGDDLDDQAMDDDVKSAAMDATPSDQLLALLKGAGLSPELMGQATSLCGQLAPAAAKDELPAPKAGEPPMTKTAMDAALKRVESDTVARMQAIHVAEKEVAPFIGALAVAMDSADAVYKLALDAAKIDTKGVHPSAFRAMVGMLTKPGDTPKPRVAMDAASVDDFAKRFPNAAKLKRVS